MKNNLIIKLSFLLAFALLVLVGCKQDEYTMGALNSPTNLVINTVIVGQNAANPNGDGSGVVVITPKADGAISYKIGFSEVKNMTPTPEFDLLKSESYTKKFNTLGDITYRITVIAYGPGGTSTVATKDIVVKSVYNPPAELVKNLTNNASKTWKVDKSVAGHFGVGPWDSASVVPQWWSAGVNEKVNCCNCFYTATFTFTQVTPTSFTLKTTTPDGAFTKTGSLAGISGIPATGGEGCYPFAGGTAPFAFIGSTSGVSKSAPSTTTSILLSGNTTFIGYGALKKEYEIMEITPTYMYLRAQGTETANAWYIKLIPAP